MLQKNPGCGYKTAPSPLPSNSTLTVSVMVSWATAAQVFDMAFMTCVCKWAHYSHVNGKHLVPSEKFHINKTYKAQLSSFEVATKHVILACEALDEEMSSIRTVAIIALN